MATVPGPNAIDSGSSERDAADLRFQRLERVRARQRSRRQRRLILVSTLALALAGASVLGFAAVRRATSGYDGVSTSPVPVTSAIPAALPLEPAKIEPAPATSAPMPTRADTAKADAASEAARANAAKPEAVKPEAVKPDAVKPDAVKPDAVKPEAVKANAALHEVPKLTGAPRAGDGASATGSAKSDVAAPRRGPLDALPVPSETPSTNRAPGAAARRDPATSDVGDPTAAIDWLLKTSRARGQ